MPVPYPPTNAQRIPTPLTGIQAWTVLLRRIHALQESRRAAQALLSPRTTPHQGAGTRLRKPPAASNPTGYGR